VIDESDRPRRPISRRSDIVHLDGAGPNTAAQASLLALFANCARSAGRSWQPMGGCVELADRCAGRGWPTGCRRLTFGSGRRFRARAAIVTIDTGATHVASAVKRPTVVLFEHTYFWLNSRNGRRIGANACYANPHDAPDALQASRAEIVAAVARLL